MTDLTIPYFSRGTGTNVWLLYADTFKIVQRYFKICCALTAPLIDATKINNDFILYGFRKSLNDVGFYTLTQKIKENIERVDDVCNRIGKSWITYEGTEEEEEEFLLDLELVERFIQSFLAQCFSRAVLLTGETEHQNKENFSRYFTDLQRRQAYSFLDEKKFIIEPALEGSFLAVPLSLSGPAFQNKIENFRKLTQRVFSIITFEERQKWRKFFQLGLDAFEEIYRENDQKLEIIRMLRPLVHQITVEPTPPTKPIPWQAKVAIAAIIMSGSALFAGIWLKRHQVTFQRYPFLAKLFPFLYQQPVQKPQKLFQEWLGLE